jgi:outer membrane protein assembly factor BamE (lipoprotein component of BamABCDE complex)
MRKWLLGLLAVSLVLVGVLVALVMLRHCPVNRAAVERIRKGMTRAEVEQILGGPPGDYRTRPGFSSRHFETTRRRDPNYGEWYGDEVMLRLVFDDGGRVGWFKSLSLGGESPTPLGIARWRLNRLLGRDPD